ncbi:MAG: dihydrofolate reductase family protein [Arachnia propionica]|uniref:dihydrofolate reductase family protein n=1 Tax=Arachnia propionica TaxID=1750 RepID=UPI0026FFBB0A|nr:dihydrofolate reductase family protein [Arachnia propionica]
MRNLVYYVASSLDGFIADPAGNFSAFPQHTATLTALFERYPETCPTHLRSTFNVRERSRRFGTVVMGHRTFLPALEAGLPHGAYPHLRQVVVTHRRLPQSMGLHVISSDVAAAVQHLKDTAEEDIWLCGGGHLASQLIDLIDEIQVKLNPVILGSGIPLLPLEEGPRSFTLVEAEVLPGGVSLLTYRPPREPSPGSHGTIGTTRRTSTAPASGSMRVHGSS